MKYGGKRIVHSTIIHKVGFFKATMKKIVTGKIPLLWHYFFDVAVAGVCTRPSRELSFEVAILQSQFFFLEISAFFRSSIYKNVGGMHVWEISDWRKKLKDEIEFEKTFIWWHILVRKTQIYLEITDLRKSQNWWPRGQICSYNVIANVNWDNYRLRQ